MKIEDRLKTYVGLTDISRRWTAVMDAKAAFVSALNGALLALLWSSIKIGDATVVAKCVGFSATFMAAIALGLALWVIYPRASLNELVGQQVRWTGKYRPFSFYAFVAKSYKRDEFKKFDTDMAKLDEADFTQEALEQHLTISHVIQVKSEWVSRAILFTGLAVIFTVASAGFKLASI